MLRWTALTVLVLATIVYLARDAAFQAIGDFLVVSDPLEPADVVIALSGNGPERLATAVGLLRRGIARTLIISGGPYTHGRRTLNSAVIMRDEAIAMGVPGSQVLVDDRATSTRENAEGTAALMRAHRLRTAIVVTSPYHTRRAAVVFRRVFRVEGLHVKVRSSDESFFSVERWWERPRDRRIVLGEYLKLAGSIGGVR